MIDHVVVDVEIQKTIEETPGGWDATDKLGVAVACLWEYETQRMRIYGPKDVEELRKRLLKADRISGFNIFNFDFPVIWGISKFQWNNWPIKSPLSDSEMKLVYQGTNGCNLKAELGQKTDDMLRRIWQALNLDPDNFNPKTHGGWKLDNVALATLGYAKIGYGGDAPKWYQAGQIQRVCNYCADDVALERDLTDYVEKYGRVLNGGKVLRIPAWKG